MSKIILTRKNQNKFKSASKAIRVLALAMGLCLITALPVTASEEVQYDDVIINDYELGFFEQLALEDHIDRDIADGRYWFELDTGLWGPEGGTAIGRIVVPEDYIDYVKARLFKPTQVAKVELATAKDDRRHVEPKRSKPSQATQAIPSVAKAELSVAKVERRHVEPKRSQPSQVAKVERSASAKECNKTCLKIFIHELVTALTPRP